MVVGALSVGLHSTDAESELCQKDPLRGTTIGKQILIIIATTFAHHNHKTIYLQLTVLGQGQAQAGIEVANILFAMRDSKNSVPCNVKTSTICIHPRSTSK